MLETTFAPHLPLKASVFIAASIDGFIARPNGDLDWLPTEKDVEGGDLGYQAFMDSDDTVVMGRHTYEKVLGFEGDWPFGGKRVVVLSTRSANIPARLAGQVSWMEGPPHRILERLAAEGARHLYIDGGRTIQAFLQARLIHRLIITRIPVLLGSGIPLFGLLENDVPLRHLRTAAYANGMAQSEYAI